jgi:hypothetical protein
MASTGADSGAPLAAEVAQQPHMDIEAQQPTQQQPATSSTVSAAGGATFQSPAGPDTRDAVMSPSAPNAGTDADADVHIELEYDEDDDDDAVGDLPAPAAMAAAAGAHLRNPKKPERQESAPKRVRMAVPPPEASAPYRQASGIKTAAPMAAPYRQSSGFSDMGSIMMPYRQASGLGDLALVAPHKPGKSVPITAYNSPKDTLLACIKAGQAKSILPVSNPNMRAQRSRVRVASSS